MPAETRLQEARPKILRLLRQWRGPLPVTAIPVAFPVRKVVYEVTERQPLEIGLVERFVIEAVERFGPISPEAIADLLGLDAQLVNRLAKKIGGDDGPLKQSAGLLVRANTAISTPHRRVTHDRAFLVEAVGGRLLPTTVVKPLDASRLIADDGTEQFFTEDGDRIWVRGSFSPHPTVDGHDDLVQLVNAEPERCEAYGLPLALVSLGERQPEKEEGFWIEAVLTHNDGVCQVRPLASPQTNLLHGVESQADFIEHACKGLGAGAFDRPPDCNQLRRKFSKLLPAARIEQGHDPFFAVVRHPGREVPVPEILAHADRRWLATLLADGLWWDQISGGIVMITPGDAATLRGTAAIRLHRQLKRDAAAVVADPEGCWNTILATLGRPDGPPDSDSANNVTPKSGSEGRHKVGSQHDLTIVSDGHKTDLKDEADEHTDPSLTTAIQMLRRVRDSGLQRHLDDLDDALGFPA